jgi:UDP-N-acetylmuramoyl-L-alanyl-D-glutamate--2,6-diaminopimelate ligase
MRLSELLGRGHVPRQADVEVAGIAIDSRDVHPGDVFFALAERDGDRTRHATEAVAAGAVAIVSAHDLVAPRVPVVRLEGPRRALGAAAARLWGDPSEALTLVGVTGTNGKTTTTYLIESIWRAAGLRPGVIGTVSHRYGDVVRPAALTTPDAAALQAMFAAMRCAGISHVAMEVSSHALVQDRVAGCRFDAAVFTNLTRDHLDFHRDIGAYQDAKARLFLDFLPAGGKPDPVAIVNLDDPVGEWLVARVETRSVPVGRGRQAAVRPLEIDTTLSGTRGVLELPGRRLRFESRLVGQPHVENMLCAAGAAWALGVDSEAIAAGLATADPPPGRLEQIAGPGFTVVVDYAHTPDALGRALEVLRPLTPGRLITVFGCGGDRDRGKRPLMGETAARQSDLLVLTSDNPRTEDPGRILADVEGGVRAAGMPVLGQPPNGRGYVVEPDRRTAIAAAIGMARAGDLVLVAGKGHEDYQIIGTERRHLDDREEVRRVLEDLW